MNEKRWNEAESLALITRMIDNSKSNMNRESGNQFMVWGITLLVVSLAVALAAYLSQHNPWINFLWMLIPLIGYGWSYMAQRKGVEVRTHIDKMVSQVWYMVTFAAVAIPTVLGVTAYVGSGNPNEYITTALSLIPSIEVIIVSFGVAATGALIDFTPIKVAGYVGIAWGVVLLSGLFSSAFTPLWFALWAILTFILPGIQLRRYFKRGVVADV